MGTLVNRGAAPRTTGLARRKVRDHLRERRPKGGGEVLRHGGREVMVVMEDHAAVDDWRALGAWAEGGGEVEDRQIALLRN